MDRQNLQERIDELFFQASQLPSDEQAAFLNAACETDELEVRQGVNRLLRVDQELDGESHFLSPDVVNLRVLLDGDFQQGMACPQCFEVVPFPSNTEISLEETTAELHCPHCDTDFCVAAPSPAADGSHAGKQLGKFELLECVGSGSFGTVWKARDTQLGRTVAIKLPHPRQFQAEEIRRRFFREGRNAAKLRHLGIVAVHEVGNEDGQIFIVSDFIDGQTLAEWLGDEPLSARQAARLCLKIANAVEHAHESGVIHRDLKPANIMMDSAGEPHIMDFGLAKCEAEDITMTMDGRIIGTPAYMSPEQARGTGDEVVSNGADIYSLGVILFQLLTGELPFRGNARQLIDQIIRDAPPSPRKLVNSVPRDLETICSKCLEKSPSARYGSVLSLSVDLARYIRGEPIQARPISGMQKSLRWCRRNQTVTTLASLLILALVSGVGVSSFLGIRFAREAAEAARARDDARAKLWDSLLSQSVSGRHSRRQGQRINGLNAIRQAAEIRPSLELRNEAIACLAQFDLRLKKSWEALPPYSAAFAFTPDLTTYAIADNDGKVDVRDVGTDRRLMRLSGDGKRFWNLRFSPNGQFLSANYNHKAWYQVWDWKKNRVMLEVENAVFRGAADFSSDSRLYAVGMQDGSIRIYDLMTGVQIGELPRGPSSVCLRFSPDDRYLAVCSPESVDVQIRDVLGIQPDRSLQHSRPVGHLTWHPDGERLATACADENAYIWNAETLELQSSMRGHEDLVSQVAFNDDGTILMSGAWDGTTRFWDSASGQQLLLMPGMRGQAWNDDGQSVALDNERRLEFWAVPQMNAMRRLQRPISGDGGRFSSDGMLYASPSEDGVWLWDVKSGRELGRIPSRITKSAHFLPDDSALITSSSKVVQRWPLSRTMGEEKLSVTVHPPVILNASGKAYGQASLSADGKSLAVIIDGNVQMINARSGELGPLLRGRKGLTTVCLSFDGTWVAGGSWRGDGVRIWNGHSGQVVKDLMNGHTEVKCQITPCGEWIYTSTGAEYRQWKLGSFTTGMKIRRHAAGRMPGDCTFSSDGAMMAVAETRHHVKLLNATTGQVLAALESPNLQPVGQLCFSKDDRWLAVSTRKQTLVWDLVWIRRRLAKMNLDWTSRPADFDPTLPHKPIEIVIDHGMPLAQYHQKRARRFTKAGKYRRALVEYERALESGPADPAIINTFAWQLATFEDNSFRDVRRSLSLAKQAVQISPRANYQNTLGLAHYRNGDWQTAIEILQNAEAVEPEARLAFNGFVLAMAYWQIGENEEARRWYQRSSMWRAKHDETNKELRRLHEEASELLGEDFYDAVDASQVLFTNGFRRATGGEWALAVADFDAAFGHHKPTTNEAWCYAAPLSLWVGDRQKYNHYCREMLVLFGDSTRTNDIERMVTTCLIGPAPPDVRKQATELAGRLPDSMDVTSLTFARGLAAYRDLQLDMAIKYLHHTERASDDPAYKGLSQSFLALAYHARGADKETRRWLALARATIDDELPSEESDRYGNWWVNWLMCQMALNEAEKSIAI